MEKLSIKPSASGLARIDGGEKFGSALRRSQALDREGRAEEACRMRFDAVQRLDDLLGDDPVALDWADGATRSCLELIYASAADHFAIGDAEMAAALWERLLELDEEDHTEAVVMLAFCYVELEDYDCLDDALFDISSKSPEYSLLALWREFRRTGGIDVDALRALRTRHRAWYDEFTAEEHPADEKYMAECRGERASASTEARELWFATAALWERHPDFIEALRRA